MKLFLFGVVIGILVVIGAVYASLQTGSVPVETSAPPLPFEQTLATKDLEARAKKEMPKQVPISAGEDTLLAGGNLYIRHCSQCHGLPGEPRPEIASGMFPPPPQLYKPDEGVTDDPPAETYWKIKNGIRLTGMPAFKGSLSDTELWQVALLVASTRNADILQRLKEQQKAQPVNTGASDAARR